MLIFPLKKQWYEKIKSGEKTIEYREVKDYWTDRLRSEISWHKSIKDLTREYFLELAERGIETNLKCKLRLGYTKEYLSAIITRIEMINGKDTDLAIDKPVYAIHLSNVREVL